MSSRVFVVTVVDTLHSHAAPVVGVFSSEESAIAEVKSMAGEDGADFGREEPVFLLQGCGLTWRGVQCDAANSGIMKFSGILVGIHSREVRP
jgi:hypothetical protein